MLLGQDAGLSGLGLLFQAAEPAHGLLAAVAAHHRVRLQRAAHGGALGMAENLAALIGAQLDAAHAGWLAVRHAGNRAGNGGGGAASAALWTTVHWSALVEGLNGVAESIAPAPRWQCEQAAAHRSGSMTPAIRELLIQRKVIEVVHQLGSRQRG
jgi:hypothetical protein